MENLSKKMALFCFILLLSSCGRGFFYARNDINTGLYTKDFLINEDSKVFIRKMYSNTNEYNGRNFSTDSISDADLIEIQYLIINPDNKIAYISTTPSRYIYDKSDSYLINKLYPNTFYFSNFYFGKYDAEKNKLCFENKNKSQEWNLTNSSSKALNLTTINNYKLKKVKINDSLKIVKTLASIESVNEALNNKVEFNLIKNFKFLAFKKPCDSNSNDCRPITDSIGNYIFTKKIKIIYTKNFKNPDFLLISFRKNINGNNNALKFKSRRIIFSKI